MTPCGYSENLATKKTKMFMKTIFVSQGNKRLRHTTTFQLIDWAAKHTIATTPKTTLKAIGIAIVNAITIRATESSRIITPGALLISFLSFSEFQNHIVNLLLSFLCHRNVILYFNNNFGKRHCLFCIWPNLT